MTTYYTVAESNNDRKNRLLCKKKIKDAMCINSRREFYEGKGLGVGVTVVNAIFHP